jgi:hypothetical protein
MQHRRTVERIQALLPAWDIERVSVVKAKILLRLIY